MAELNITCWTKSACQCLPGVGLAIIIALTALLLSQIPSVASLGLGSLTLALIIGAVLGNTRYRRITVKHPASAGILFSRHALLRLGIVLYAFRLTFQQIADMGVAGLLIDFLTLSSTFYPACMLGKYVFSLDSRTVWLIGAGSSICGVAAILATAPVIKAEASKVAVAVATVVIFGTLGLFLYPIIWHSVSDLWPQTAPRAFGIYAGSTLHEVAQVVAAGHAIGPESENAAVIAKMLRVMMLAPFLLILGALVQRSTTLAGREKQPIAFPWFALLFILVALLNSLRIIPREWVTLINQCDNLLLAIAMAALGLTTHISALKSAGIRPILLGLALFVWLIVGGGAINLLAHDLMG